MPEPETSFALNERVTVFLITTFVVQRQHGMKAIEWYKCETNVQIMNTLGIINAVVSAFNSVHVIVSTSSS